jgi:hypothetical protein
VSVCGVIRLSTSRHLKKINNKCTGKLTKLFILGHREDRLKELFDCDNEERYARGGIYCPELVPAPGLLDQGKASSPICPYILRPSMLCGEGNLMMSREQSTSRELMRPRELML